jgi:site-specific DNA-methyltransferase (adenine-specific)
MVERLIQGGFRLDFTPIYWTYASGFPKAGNIGKLVDKRLGAKREVLGTRKSEGGRSGGNNEFGTTLANIPKEIDITAPATPQAKALDGSYTGFQPKPAVEVIIVAMKPLSEKTYVDQAMTNGHGVSWLDDARIGTGTGETKTVKYPDIRGDNYSQGKGSYTDKPTVEYTVTVQLMVDIRKAIVE